VALFGRKTTSATSSAQDGPPRALFGPGRRFRVSQPISQVPRTLITVLNNHAPTPYEHMDPIFGCSITWRGSAEDRPDEAWYFTDADKTPSVLILKDLGGETEAGLFPFGATDQRLGTPPIVGPWKMAESSLSSIGRFPGGSIELRPPEVDSEYFEKLLELGGFPPTPQNVTTLAATITEQFLIKAGQFVQMKAGPRARRTSLLETLGRARSLTRSVFSTTCASSTPGSSRISRISRSAARASCLRGRVECSELWSGRSSAHSRLAIRAGPSWIHVRGQAHRP
jgi:hypothetical protein